MAGRPKKDSTRIRELEEELEYYKDKAGAAEDDGAEKWRALCEVEFLAHELLNRYFEMDESVVLAMISGIRGAAHLAAKHP